MYIRRSQYTLRKAPTKLAGWYGSQLWLWRGKPEKLTLVKVSYGRSLTMRK